MPGTGVAVKVRQVYTKRLLSGQAPSSTLPAQLGQIGGGAKHPMACLRHAFPSKLCLHSLWKSALCSEPYESLKKFIFTWNSSSLDSAQVGLKKNWQVKVKYSRRLLEMQSVNQKIIKTLACLAWTFQSGWWVYVDTCPGPFLHFPKHHHNTQAYIGLYDFKASVISNSYVYHSITVS